MGIDADPTGGGAIRPSKALALKEIAAIKKAVNGLEKTVRGIKEAPQTPVRPKA